MSENYMGRAKWLADHFNPEMAKRALLEGGAHYAQSMVNSIHPFPMADVALVIAAATAMASILSRQYPGQVELAQKLAPDLEKMSIIGMIPDPDAIKKWREQQHPPE